MKTTISRIILLLVLLIVANSLSKAQDKAESLELGIKAGINISNLYTTDTSVSDMIYGFNAGVYLKATLTKMIAIQPEFYVSTKGASIRYNDLLLDGTARFNLTYLELPVLCEIQASQHIKFEFGPYISYLVGAKVTNMVDINLFDFQKNVDVNKFNRIDAGLIIGAGIVVHTVTVGVRYAYGFATVGKTQTLFGTSYTIPNANNGIVSFYMTIPLNKMEKDPITNQYSLYKKQSK
jgi:hypothetical protein